MVTGVYFEEIMDQFFEKDLSINGVVALIDLERPFDDNLHKVGVFYCLVL